MALRALVLGCLLLSPAGLRSQQYPAMPSEMPSEVKIPAGAADYTRRVVMIPMRDGVKLNTVILIPKSAVPKGAKGVGILLTRTPYSAAALTTNSQS